MGCPGVGSTAQLLSVASEPLTYGSHALSPVPVTATHAFASLITLGKSASASIVNLTIISPTCPGVSVIPSQISSVGVGHDATIGAPIRGLLNGTPA